MPGILTLPAPRLGLFLCYLLPATEHEISIKHGLTCVLLHSYLPPVRDLTSH